MQPEDAGGEVLQTRECVPAGQPSDCCGSRGFSTWRAERGSQTGTHRTKAEEEVWEGAGIDLTEGALWLAPVPGPGAIAIQPGAAAAWGHLVLSCSH